MVTLRPRFRLKKSSVKGIQMRKRIFNIIQIGSNSDLASRAFDFILVFTIFLNISVTFMQTFDALEECFTLFRVIEVCTLILFCIEYILRIVTADFLYPEETPLNSRLKFILSFEGIIELLTILPFFVFTGFGAFRLLRVVRIFHVFRVNTKVDSFNIISLVIKEKWKQVTSSVLLIFIFMLASSLGMYAVEHDVQPQVFQNAFSGMWWSMSTLLTIGYGDIYPITITGRVMAILISFLGVGLVAIPTGIISAGFVEQYQYRTHIGRKLVDINDIGEIKIGKNHPFAGRSLAEIEADKTLKILLVIREDLKLIPSDSLIITENDILVIESERVVKE